ncbi:MAG: glycosyltransferase family 4 protein [Nitrososphaeria archaeon]
MKLAMFCWEFPPRIVGGLGSYISEITPKIISKGHDITVFTFNDGKLKTHDVFKGIEVHRPEVVDMTDVFPSVVSEDIARWGSGTEFFSEVMTSNILSSAKLINQLVKFDNREFNLIVAHDWLSFMGGIISKRELKLPLVTHFHSTEKGRSVGDGSKTIVELETIGGKIADKVITVSCAMIEDLAHIYVPIEKINVVYNGVDPHKYDPTSIPNDVAQIVRKRYNIKDDETMLLFVGRLVPVKGVDKLIYAMEHVNEKYPKAKLVIVGTSDNEQYYSNLISNLKLDKIVIPRFEFISEEERIIHYAACDMAIFPSLYEPFGIVALEAMSMEKPVIVGARGISGLREIVLPSGPDQCGVHVNPYDPADIAWGIGVLLSDMTKSKQFGVNGRKRVLANFTWDKVADDTIKVYKQLVK